MSSLLPVDQDLVTRLLLCSLGARDRVFVQSLVGRQAITGGQWNWLQGLAARHRRKLRALKQAAGVGT